MAEICGARPAPAFTCAQCGRAACHPLDVAYQYCAACHVFAGQLESLARLLGPVLPPHARLYPLLPGFLAATWRAVLDGTPFDLVQWAWGQGYPYVRALPDGRLVGVQVLMPDGARLWLGGRHAREGVWIYASLPAAVAAARTWDGTGEPAPGSGSRTCPGLDPGACPGLDPGAGA